MNNGQNRHKETNVGHMDSKMKMYIPNLGDSIILSREWMFTLHEEYRNFDFCNRVANKMEDRTRKYVMTNSKLLRVRLPADTELVIDRIYIRKGSEDFNSVTFRIKSCPVKHYEN